MSRSRDLANLADEATGGLVKADIGLGNVDNTSDANKPISTAQQPYVDAIQYQGEPHIIPGVLYPAIAGKLLDGTTSHSGNYGTAQTQTGGDGRSYYYTDIKGSKPIKDPRIGAHFGSQRHKFKSIQLLEQETATHGSNIYSVDGREWIRGVGDWEVANVSSGHLMKQVSHNNNATDRIEIVGYFSGANLIGFTGTADKAEFSVNGGSASTSDFLNASVNTPLNGRYVDAGGVVHLTSSLTLGINTLTIIPDGTVGTYYYGIELIAQDTSNRNNIQIPSQNVVSYGKKFTVSGTPHYNPFATKGDGSASTIPDNTTGDSVATGWAGSTSAYWDSSLDTATSLGLDAWVSGGNYYRPVNGGRVVKWVDSAGAIKTSVNMMPPEAHQINANGTGTCDATGTTNWSSAYQPVFGNKRVGSDLITNGTFASDTAWTKETGITIGSGKIHMQGSSTHAFHQSVSSLVIGREYKATYTISEYSSGGARLYVDGGGGRPYHEANGTYSYSFIATATSHSVGLGGKSGVTDNLKVDDFSLYEIDPPEAQAEVAKTYFVREFGNGSANGGTGATYADASMLTASTDDIAYVMDDGLTSLSANDVQIASTPLGLHLQATDDTFYVTFIGTGLTIVNNTDFADGGNNQMVKYNLVQNLPFGTHILEVKRTSTYTSSTIKIDGVQIHTGWIRLEEVIFHQPKKPPIPEDACVISDYCLMADFVPQTSAGDHFISKGVRRQNVSRDVFCDETDGNAFTFNIKEGTAGGFRLYLDSTADSDTTVKVRIPSFGTNYVHRGYQSDTRSKLFIGDTDNDSNATKDNTAGYGSYAHLTSSLSLGIHQFGSNAASGQNGNVTAYDIATPIHTSHHYQTFETPFLHELVGGDRNMEQTNLVCSPDGRSWDQLTRDTSYLGPPIHNPNTDTEYTAGNATTIFDEHRGTSNGKDYKSKNFTPAYDRQICLVNGLYKITHFTIRNDATDTHSLIRVNGTNVVSGHASDANHDTITITITMYLKRGDYVEIRGRRYEGTFYTNFEIQRLD